MGETYPKALSPDYVVPQGDNVFTFLVDVTKCMAETIILAQGLRTHHGRKAWQRVCEAASHIVSNVRKQRETKASGLFAFPLETQSMEWCQPYSRQVFLCQLNLPGDTLT